MTLTPAQIKAASDRDIDINAQGCGFDYRNQAWIVLGKYCPCGHAGTQHTCNCYGRKHASQSANLQSESVTA